MGYSINDKEKVWTLIELVNWTSGYFKKHQIESPRLKTELLLCHLLNYDRIQIYTNYDKPIMQLELSKFKTLIQRVVANEPVQMIVGKTVFRNLEIEVNDSTIVPRPETEQLVGEILKETKDANYNILDIGTGSGCIALSLAKQLMTAHITGIDISEKSIALANHNAEINGIDNVTFLTADVYKCLFDSKFDIIVSNPPYIDKEEYLKLAPEILNYEPKQALTDGEDGLSFYRFFASKFPTMLKPNGTFYLEIGWNQANEVVRIFESNNYRVELIKDWNNIERIIKGKLIC